MYGIKDKLLKEIIDCIKKNNKIRKAVIFGSRARNEYNEKSDIDIAIYSNGSPSDINRIRDALEELNCVYKIDVVDVNEIDNNTMLNHINTEGITIYEA